MDSVHGFRVRCHKSVCLDLGEMFSIPVNVGKSWTLKKLPNTHLAWLGSLVSIRLAISSSMLSCLSPTRKSKIMSAGAGERYSQPRGISTHECFSARSSQRSERGFARQRWARASTRVGDQNMVGRCGWRILTVDGWAFVCSALIRPTWFNTVIQE